MKRLITIAFILLAQISFGQIKTIKVRGAGGGSTYTPVIFNGTIWVSH